jgi:hypothetical protein
MSEMIFDQDVDARIEAMRRQYFPGEINLGPARELTVKKLGDFRTRWDILAAIVILAAGLPTALLMRALGL